MGTTKDALKDKFTATVNLVSDPSVPVGEVTAQVYGTMQTELSAAMRYTTARKERKKAVAERLQETRKARKLKQQDVAEMTGINVVTLSGYEIAKNEPNMEALVRLADAYQVSLDYLMCREEE